MRPIPTGEHVVVETKAGAVRGFWRTHSAAFLGIPYAEPPFGEQRFGAPVPRAPWAGVRDAVDYAPTPQRKALAEITTIPEPSIPGADILTLNVFTPQPSRDAEPLPVMVYIHGGGYVAGSPASPWYDGAAFNRDGIVTVSIAYRLGFDGFGWLPDAPLNRGILDQLLALEWVRDNIAAFGGDPNRVTIAGQSAGGGRGHDPADDAAGARAVHSGGVDLGRAERHPAREGAADDGRARRPARGRREPGRVRERPGDRIDHRTGRRIPAAGGADRRRPDRHHAGDGRPAAPGSGRRRRPSSVGP